MPKSIKIKSAPRQFQPFLNDAEELIGKYAATDVGQKDGFIKTAAEANSALEACLRTQGGCQGLKSFIESHGYKLISQKKLLSLSSEINNTGSVRRLLALASQASKADSFSLAWKALDKALTAIRSYPDKKKTYLKANQLCDAASVLKEAGVRKFVVRNILIEALKAANRVPPSYSAYDSYVGAYKTHILCKIGQARARAGLNKKETYEPFKMALGAALASSDPVDALELVVCALTDSGLTDEALIAVRTAKIVREDKELKIEHHKIRVLGIIALKRYEAGAKKPEIINIFRQAIRIARAAYEDERQRYKAMTPLRTHYFSAAGLNGKDKEALMDELLEVQLEPIK